MSSCIYPDCPGECPGRRAATRPPECRFYVVAERFTEQSALAQQGGEFTGGSVSYYKVKIAHPTSDRDSYEAECNDIIEALGMNYAEGNAFKAIWRSCAARTLNINKRGYDEGLYDAEKVVFFGQRMVAQRGGKK
jgi:hypothetical protein